MRLSLILFIALLFTQAAIAQIIVTDPAFPTDDNPVVITYDATQGSGGLQGYTGDVYAHTGVITNQSSTSSDWRYVMSEWGQNIPETKMSRIGEDLYELEITPDIRDYYGVPSTELIQQMAFVFRSDVPVGGGYLEGKTASGGDIFVDVHPGGMSVSFQNPAITPVLITPGESFPLTIHAVNADSILLYVDDVLVNSTDTDVLEDTIIGTEFGNFKVHAVAKSGIEAVVDSFYYHVRTPVQVAGLPAGIKDGVNYIDENTAILSLFAPNKEFVNVLGDFNGWMLDSTNQMYLTPDSMRYWLQLDNLVAGEEYVFQYLVDGIIRIGDPYADKTSDPEDDYIDEATYPGLIEYPLGKAKGLATVLQTNQEAYQWQVDNFTPAAATDLVIYELLVRDFTEEHTFQAIIDTLAYLEELGINAIELMPVNEFEHNLSWGYNPVYYFAVDKYYGPKNTLKALIDECHQRGIAVIMDIVLNHAYSPCPLVQLYFEGGKPSAESPWFNEEHNFTNPDAHWGNDFNHESIYTQQLVDSITSYWMSEYRFDGFRFDFTKGFGNNIKGPDDPWGSIYDADRIALLKRMSHEIWKRNPEAIVIFEHLADNNEERNLSNYGILMWGNLSHTYGEASMGYNAGNNSDFNWISYQERGWNDPHVVGYMESHDEERIMFKNYNWGLSSGDYSIKDTTIALTRIQLLTAFFYTIPGPKMIWQFGERGFDYSIDFNGRLGEKPPRWDYMEDWRRNYLFRHVSTLINLKKEYDVFRTEDFELHLSSGRKKIILRHESMDVVIIGNFGTSDHTIDPTFTHTGDWYDYFTGDKLTVEDVNEWILLDPGEYRIYTDVQLPVPDIGTAVDEPSQIEDDNVVLLFPNPTSGPLHLRVTRHALRVTSMDLYSISGMRIERLIEEEISPGTYEMDVDVSDLPAGIYFVRVLMGNQVVTKKLVVQ